MQRPLTARSFTASLLPAVTLQRSQRHHDLRNGERVRPKNRSSRRRESASIIGWFGFFAASRSKFPREPAYRRCSLLPLEYLDVRDEGMRRADILSRTFAELPEDQLNRNTGPADDGFSQHYFWIDFYTISDCHGNFLKPVSYSGTRGGTTSSHSRFQRDSRSVPLSTPTSNEHVFFFRDSGCRGSVS